MSVNSFTNLNPRFRRYLSYVDPVVSDPLVRGYFSFVASLILTTFLLIFALSPTINTILGLRKKIDDQNQTLVALDTKTSVLVAAAQSYQQVEDYLPLLSRAMPAETQPTQIINTITFLASASAVTVASLQFPGVPLGDSLPPAAANSDVSVLNFSLSVNGRKPNVESFLGKLENALRYIRVGSMSIGTDQKSGLTSADITGLGYYFPML
jgi:hypothetical protein